MGEKARQFGVISDRIKSLREDKITEKANELVSISTIGLVEYCFTKHPIYQIIAQDKNSKGKKNNILISGGVHGDEPAGVYASLNFLEAHIKEYLRYFNFVIYPCINPSGFMHNTLTNYAGDNINRNFKHDTDVQENRIVLKSLKKCQKDYLITLDLHEVPFDYEGEGFKKDDNPTEFYLYENCADTSLRIGDKIIKKLEGKVPICKRKTIYNDINSGGVVWYPEGNLNAIYAENTSFDCFLLAQNYTKQSFTIETPTGWGLRDRVDMQVKAVTLALDEILERDRVN